MGVRCTVAAGSAKVAGSGKLGKAAATCETSLAAAAAQSARADRWPVGLRGWPGALCLPPIASSLCCAMFDIYIAYTRKQEESSLPNQAG